LVAYKNDIEELYSLALRIVQTSSGDHPASYKTGTMGYFLGRGGGGKGRKNEWSCTAAHSIRNHAI